MISSIQPPLPLPERPRLAAALEQVIAPVLPPFLLTRVRRSSALKACFHAGSRPVKRWLLRGAAFGEIYGADYFRRIEETTERSAPVMATSIAAALHPVVAADIGCGTGDLMLALQALGISVFGFDCSEFALARCRDRKLNAMPVDLASKNLADHATPNQCDVAISMEVGHQLPENAGSGYVRFLCRLAPVVVFSSDSSRDDRLPLNPQRPAYWQKKFLREGFQLDAETSLAFQREWREAGVAPWFHRGPMVFRRIAQQ